MKSLARQLYDEYFREAEATPRGVVAKLKTIVKQLDSALAIQIGHLRVSSVCWCACGGVVSVRSCVGVHILNCLCIQSI